MTTDPRKTTVRLGGKLVRLVGSATLRGKAAALADEDRSANTVRVYAGHIRRFGLWARAERRDPFDPIAVADYLAACYAGEPSAGRTGAPYGVMALRQCATALRCAYQALKLPAEHPEWAQVIKGARVKIAADGRLSRGRAEALRLDDLRAAVRYLYRLGTPIAMRDRALLLIGYLAALRRVSLIGLNVTDITADKHGLEVAIRNEKTTRGDVTYAAIPRGRFGGSEVGDGPSSCPVRAWEDWQEARPRFLPLDGAPEPAWLSAHRSGGIIASTRLGGDRSVERILHRALAGAGIDPLPYSAHSLRAGLATELAECGVSLVDIAKAGRWTSIQTAARYADRARRWEDSPLPLLVY